MTALSVRDIDARGARRLLCAILVQAVRDMLAGDIEAVAWLGPIAGEIVDVDAAWGHRYTDEQHRTRTPATHCKPGHEYTPENTRTTARQRQCRVCAVALRRAKREGLR